MLGNLADRPDRQELGERSASADTSDDLNAG